MSAKSIIATAKRMEREASGTATKRDRTHALATKIRAILRELPEDSPSRVPLETKLDALQEWHSP